MLWYGMIYSSLYRDRFTIGDFIAIHISDVDAMIVLYTIIRPVVDRNPQQHYEQNRFDANTHYSTTAFYASLIINFGFVCMYRRNILM